MLSYIYKIARDYEKSHGENANVLYLNRSHFEYLRKEFASPEDIRSILQLLGMNIIISDETVQPHLCKTQRVVRNPPGIQHSYLTRGAVGDSLH